MIVFSYDVFAVLTLYICFMKLRISDQSLRLRINIDDLDLLARNGRIKHAFGNQKLGILNYELMVKDVPTFDINMTDRSIEVVMPKSHLDEWIKTNRVGFEADIKEVRLLLEKDFQCLTDRPNEDESRNFKNPKNHH